MEFWNNNGERRELGNVQHKFKLVSFERQLQRWADQLELSGTFFSLVVTTIVSRKGKERRSF